MKKIQPVILASICSLACALPSTFAFSQTTENNATKNQAVTSDASAAYQQAQKSKAYNIGAGSLTQTLNRFAQQTGVVLVFEPDLTGGKTSVGLNGQFTTQTGFAQILKGTGLEAASNANGGYSIKKISPPPAKAIIPTLGEKDNTKDIQLDKITVRAKRFHEIGPLPGLGLTKEEIPGNVQSISAKEIKDSHSLSLTDLMNKKLQSVNVNDYAGNPFQMDITYRGFTAGPQIGTPQGLSVFFDGIRVNEPFGDVVNWDMIPMNAIAGVDVFPGSNPIFGLNTLGGAFTLKTKDGFNNAGVDAEILAGSYGRKQLQVSAGKNNGTFALFGAGNFFLEDGWRNDSPSKVNQFFGKGSYRGEKLDLNLSTLLVSTDLVGNGLLPSEEYARNPSSVFTSPDTSKNRLMQFQLSGAFQVSDNFSITGQAYRRNSKRHQVGADALLDKNDESNVARRLPATDPITGITEEFTCKFLSSNAYKLPDYYVLTVPNPTDAVSQFYTDNTIQGFINTNTFDPSLTNNAHALDPSDPSYTANSITFNADLPKFMQDYLKGQVAGIQNSFQKFILDKNGVVADQGGDVTDYSFGETSYVSDYFAGTAFDLTVDPLRATGTYYYEKTKNGVTKNLIFFNPPTNAANCLATQATGLTGSSAVGGPAYAYIDPVTNKHAQLNGANSFPGQAGIDYIQDPITGKRYYTPTSVITDNKIDQTVDGASIQFNWNLEHHKLMVGASIDAAEATYTNSQMLGLLDANRKAYLAPDQIHPMFAGASEPFINNNFDGTNTTKSLYISETWSPVDTWHFNASARYNHTDTQTNIAARYAGGQVGLLGFLAYPDTLYVCPDAQCTGYQPNYKLPNTNDFLNKAETEKFSYHSLNPSIGATWQVKENVNVFANLAQGTRVPSAIELGCAIDKTPVNIGSKESPVYIPKSIFEERQCSLPSTLSGDPYLKQIKATTYDIGARGNLTSMLGLQDIQWNVGAYQTDLKDDIYFTTFGNGQGFFNNIGKTKRRGLEAGVSGRKDKWTFGLNYGLTDATFQDDFIMISEDNSSAFNLAGYGNVIQVKKGNRMPGVPLHNLNANVSYEITPKWQVGLTVVAHSESFVRGNENNAHQQGVSRIVQSVVADPNNPGNFLPITYALPPTANPGTVPAYAMFNFQTSYKFNKEWTATLLINNLFDSEYFTAGRLGSNPFSPNSGVVTAGAIGSDGYNHNSDNWQTTNFISPGAPRGIWFSLNWQFDAKK